MYFVLSKYYEKVPWHITPLIVGKGGYIIKELSSRLLQIYITSLKTEKMLWFTLVLLYPQKYKIKSGSTNQTKKSGSKNLFPMWKITIAKLKIKVPNILFQLKPSITFLLLQFHYLFRGIYSVFDHFQHTPSLYQTFGISFILFPLPTITNAELIAQTIASKAFYLVSLASVSFLFF